MARILILEGISSVATDLLKRCHSVDQRLGASRADTLARVKTYDAIIVRSLIQVDRELLDAAPNLKIVGRAGVGTDNIDLDLARQRGVRVLTVAGGNAVSAAEFTIMQILNLIRNAYEAQNRVAAGDFRRAELQGWDLSELCVGIVGLGHVGSAVAKRLRPFGCRLIGYERSPDHPAFVEIDIECETDFNRLLGRVDVLTLHVPLTDQTRGILSREALAQAKPGLFLVNTARGGLVVDEALLWALERDIVAGAALDVLGEEPPLDTPPGVVPYDHAFLGHPRIHVTPHMAASTHGCQHRIAVSLAEQMTVALDEGALAEKMG